MLGKDFSPVMILVQWTEASALVQPDCGRVALDHLQIHADSPWSRLQRAN